MESFLKRKNRKNCFKTIITEWESYKKLYVSKELLNIKKDDKITIKGKYYEVDHINWDFDKKEFEVVVWEV